MRPVTTALSLLRLMLRPAAVRQLGLLNRECIMCASCCCECCDALTRVCLLQARVLSDAAAVMVLDHKGRIKYATSKLATMLGYSASSLTKMELNALLPQPYCQMHSAWFKVGAMQLSSHHRRALLVAHTISWLQDAQTMKVQPTGCRGGGVVHLLRANGARHPVTVSRTAWLAVAAEQDGCCTAAW